MGQGVLCLREMFQAHMQQGEEHGKEQVAVVLEEEGKGVLTRVDVCAGGKLVGTLEARVCVSVRRI